MAKKNGNLDHSDVRHGSESSVNSWRSVSTVRDRPPRSSLSLTANGSGLKSQPKTSRSGSYSQESTRDGGSVLNSPASFESPDVSPTDQRMLAGFGNHRKALAVLGAGDYFTPPPAPPMTSSPSQSSNHEPSSKSNLPPIIPPISFSSTPFGDSLEYERSPVASPVYRSGTGRPSTGDLGDPAFDADRRPSVASATTVSSNGSRSSVNGRFRKRLQGFFGDEYQMGQDQRLDQDGSFPRRNSRDTSLARARNNSVGSRHTIDKPGDGAISPSSSRPRTPLPSSEVTPWMYQRFNDIPQFGEAPVRSSPTGPDSERYVKHNGSASIHSLPKELHRLHLPGHRHSRSKEEKPTSSGSADSAKPGSSSTGGGKDDFGLALRPQATGSMAAAMSSSSTLGRSSSPTPSMRSNLLRDGTSHHSSHANSKKAGFLDRLDKIRRKPKVPEPFKNAARSAKRELSPGRRRHGSFDSQEGLESDRKKELGRSTTIGHRPFKRAGRGVNHDVPGPREGEPPEESEGIFKLDTDLDHMDDIIKPRPLSPTDTGGIFDGNGTAAQPEDPTKEVAPAGNWDAPESWQVKKQGDDLVKGLPEIGGEGEGVALDDGLQYFIRIFRIDSTFATLYAGLNATVADILVLLGRKSFLQDDLNNYELVIRKNDVSRQLEHGERPILIQKRLLEQVGYTAADRIEDIGREDHSYLCRFIFLPTKLSDYPSLENDPNFNKSQKFSHVDLSGRNLITIPITLYKKAPEIISLNLSRNLALDVPSDFIQSCINLRKIKFMSNEAWRLPPSLSLATRLTYLDISNNRLEDLSYANLDQLEELVSVKIANNKLTSLPPYFGNYKSLRSLDLSSNSFQVFPEFLCNLPSLVELDISFNGIRELPNIGALTTLERLWMTNNMLAGPLDDSFKRLASIKEIDARFNSITNVDSVMQLPRLESLLLGHNSITKFRGSFPKLRTLVLDHCALTQFELDAPVPTLSSLNVASCKLVQFRDSFFEFIPNMTKLILDKNHFVSLSPSIGKLRRLEHFSIIKNPLSSLPATIGCLVELKYLNLRECNLTKLPPEIWYCQKLETLNVSSNLLDSFPKHTSQPPTAPGEGQWGTPGATPGTTPGVSNTPSYENLDPLEEEDDEGTPRRLSQASGLLNIGSPPSAFRNNSVVSNSTGRKASTASRSQSQTTDSSGSLRKDSSFSQRLAMSFAHSLRNLFLADNRLEDDIFRELSMLVELRVLNLSYNELTELPPGLLKRWQSLSDLYISGNELTSLPSDDLEETSNLKTLHINANRFQVLPAELCKVKKLAILDVGNNALKYNVSNWPYDWNWNWNHNLKYLNFSGNKRLEIKPNIASLGSSNVNGADLTEFNSLEQLRILGLMDVTLTIKTVPEETEDRRVRTSASLAGSLAYGMADSLGKSEHLSIIDMMVPRLRSEHVDTLIGMFDGQTQLSGGSKVAKFLHENFTSSFVDELKKLNTEKETPLDAMRRTFLGLDKEIAAAAYKSIDDRELRPHSRTSTAAKLLNQEDINSGGVATVIYLNNMDMYVANVGDAQAVLVKSDGSFKHLTANHDPAQAHERARIRTAGGFVSRNGKLNDLLPVSRAFGYFQLMPAVIAAPHTAHFKLAEQDEMIIVASREVWDYVTPDFAVDVARAERRDLMIAAQKIRDLAIAFGASNKLMVMIVGVSGLKKRERLSKFRGASLSMGPSSFPEDTIVPSVQRKRKARDGPGDSRLARFDYVDAPVGELAIIFTDIKQSTSLWETCPDAMRSAIQIHNDVLRRQLGIVGGYEVKTEGDAFMVAFSTTTAALLWCFNCQTQLLEAEWPAEILEQPQCKEWYDGDQNLIYRGLSVRMGSHWGEPVCEKDPVTGRMDYFGPMVNRASRISAVADGGQIFVSSDFMSEFSRTREVYADNDRSPSISGEYGGDPEAFAGVRRELLQLNSLGFIIKDQGEKKLKGLENPESVFLVSPHALAGRLDATSDAAPREAPSGSTVATMIPNSELDLETDVIWQLWEIVLRLESLCSALETPGQANLNKPNQALFNVVRNKGGELADSTVLTLIDQQVTRIESSVNTLALRHLMRPFKAGDTLQDHTFPIADVMTQLQTQLAEFKALKEQLGGGNLAIPDPSIQIAVNFSTTPRSSRSGLNSNSSSHVGLVNGSSTP